MRYRHRRIDVAVVAIVVAIVVVAAVMEDGAQKAGGKQHHVKKGSCKIYIYIYLCVI